MIARATASTSRPPAPGATAASDGLLRAQHELVDLARLVLDPGAGGERARAVRAVAVEPAAPVDRHELPALDLHVARLGVRQRAVRAARRRSAGSSAPARRGRASRSRGRARSAPRCARRGRARAPRSSAASASCAAARMRPASRGVLDLAQRRDEAAGRDELGALAERLAQPLERRAPSPRVVEADPRRPLVRPDDVEVLAERRARAGRA